MADKVTGEIISRLAGEISDDVGNMHEDELSQISADFDKTLSDALKTFNSSTFDDDGFIKKMRDLDLGGGQDKDMVRKVLRSFSTDYMSVESLNQSELLLRRDLANICTQMPEMRDVIYVVRDAIIECNVSTGEVSRQLIFENHSENEAWETQVKELEIRHNLLMAIKNFIVPNTLKTGEMYIQVVPYAKLFAEIEALKDSKMAKGSRNMSSEFHESIPTTLLESFKAPVSLYSPDNLKVLMESVSPTSKDAGADAYNSDHDKSTGKSLPSAPDAIAREGVSFLLNNIEVYNGSSTLSAEYGAEAFSSIILREYKESVKHPIGGKKSDDPAAHFMEAINLNNVNDDIFGNIDQDDVDFKTYNEIKGCYIKYLDSLKIVPIRIDRRVIGYYYVTTTMDAATNPASPNGIVDLSYMQYTRDRNMVEQLANMIIRSFDKKMLEKNIKLKSEIAEIIMAHKFSEGKLSFVYIPENEVIRLIINEDEEAKGHSILEPTMFSARNYLLLTMYNMLYTLNNNTTRVHYVKSSGLNKDYAAQVQRTMRKFQSRRITVDDIYSYSGVLNKIGGMGEMVLPAGRNDYKALETDTIEAVQNPINIEFLEQQRRQAISGTGVPNLLIINAIDEVDFAKTLEMANTRFLSTVSSYKIDFNNGITKLYQRLLRFSTDMEPEVIQSFRFKFNAVRQPEMNITADMITNFNNIVEAVMSAFYSKAEMEDEKGNPTPRQKHLRRKLAEKYLPQLDFDELDEIVKEVELKYPDDVLQDKVNQLSIEKEDLEEIEGEES